MSKEINVLQLIDSLNVGGAEVLAVNIFNLLAEKKNIQSYLCATREEGELQKKIKNRSNYLFLNRTKTIDIKAIFKLKKFVKTNKITIIHAHSSSYFMAFCIKLIVPSVKIIWHDHYGKSDFLSERKTTPLHLISNFFSYIITVNEKLRLWSVKNLQCKKVVFINNFASFNDSLNTTVLKGSEGKRIVHLGAFRPQKDHLNLLQAFNQVIKKHSDYTLHLIGNGTDIAYKNKINAYIDENNLQNNVFLYGICSDIKNILQQSTIGVLSSKSEGLPVALLEYGLAKLPVVVTNVGECGKVVKNNFSGLVVLPEDTISLQNGLLYCIENKDKRKFFATNFNNDILKKYSKDNFLDKIITIYKEV